MFNVSIVRIKYARSTIGYSEKKKQICVDYNAYISGVTHMRQEFTVCEIKSHFSIVCRFYLFSHTKKHKKEQIRCF